MVTNQYLKWLSQTASYWWHDNAVFSNIDQAIENGATGVTTNPLLVKKSLYADPDFWRPFLQGAKGLKGAEKIEEIIRLVTAEIAKKFLPVFEASKGTQGFVCAQVDPNLQGDAEAMFSMGKRLALWAPNVAVKVPMTAAGIEAIEELTALGITTVGTVSFSVPQVLEVGKRQQRGLERAKKSGIKPGAVFSAIMCGRVDDYLRDVAKDCKANIAESDIIQAGTACIKRAYGLCKELGYESKPIPAGLRGAYHVTSLAGADIVMSLAVNIQDMLSKETEFSEHINESVAKSVIDNLLKIPEFVRAYEPDGMKSEEFIRYGAVQRTLSQFIEAGWSPIEEFEI